jgi:peptidoglycan/LPS O-acetylase OafA/YrhL
MTYPLYLIHFTLGVATFNALVPTLHPWLALPVVVSTICGLSWIISAKFEDRLRLSLDTGLRQVLRVAPRRHSQATIPRDVAQPQTIGAGAR